MHCRVRRQGTPENRFARSNLWGTAPLSERVARRWTLVRTFYPCIFSGFQGFIVVHSQKASMSNKTTRGLRMFGRWGYQSIIKGVHVPSRYLASPEALSFACNTANTVGCTLHTLVIPFACWRTSPFVSTGKRVNATPVRLFKGGAVSSLALATRLGRDERETTSRRQKNDGMQREFLPRLVPPSREEVCDAAEISLNETVTIVHEKTITGAEAHHSTTTVESTHDCVGETVPSRPAPSGSPATIPGYDNCDRSSFHVIRESWIGCARDRGEQTFRKKRSHIAHREHIRVPLRVDKLPLVLTGRPVESDRISGEIFREFCR